MKGKKEGQKERKKETERRGRVFNIPATYSGGLGFKYRPEDWLS
jgi:hypothetical protein